MVFFCNFCFTEMIISHWKLFLVVSLSGEMVREKIVRQTKPGGVARPGVFSVLRRNTLMTSYSDQEWATQELPLVAG